MSFAIFVLMAFDLAMNSVYVYSKVSPSMFNGAYS